MSKLVILFFVCLVSLDLSAQTIVTPAHQNDDKKNKKKVVLDFEEEVIKGDNNVPELLLLNSRKLIRYKDLFNKRTNFIDEIDANKGLFNENQK